MKKFFRELGEFASQRSVGDVALGLIIGAALGRLVQVLVEEVILPPISFFTYGMNLENRSLVLREAASIDGLIPLEDIAIGWGKMLSVAIEFVVIGLVIFSVVKLARSVWGKSQTLLPDDEHSFDSKDTQLMEKVVTLLERQTALLERRNHKTDSKQD